MPSASEPPSGPWVHGWGRGVVVRSDRDVADVLHLLAASDGDELAVVFERLTRQQRESLIRRLEASSVSLRPFDNSDKQRAHDADAASPRRLVVALVLASPFLLFMRLRRRATVMYAARRAETSSTDASVGRE